MIVAAEGGGGGIRTHERGCPRCRFSRPDLTAEIGRVESGNWRRNIQSSVAAAVVARRRRRVYHECYMEALLWLIFGCLCLGGVVVAGIGDQRGIPRVALLGAVLLVAGGVLLAVFVFSGDPYTNGDGSRWSHRQFHGLVYVSWVASAIGAAFLFALSRAPRPRSVVAAGLVIGAAVILLQAVAATSQNVN